MAPNTGGKITNGVKKEIGSRDGWRCRYCSLPVVSAEFLKAVKEAFPGSDFPESPVPVEGTAYPARTLFRMSVDHVSPLAAGGSADSANLVSACGACNFAKSACSLEELRLSDPFERPPIRDGWKGLQGRGRTSGS